ncbi:gamma-glutamylcyclotransferase [Geobacillus subterraneus]|uniref:Gamma-glutamylcyclotransferase n=2 Tax=Geobacillus TaxID=129337 RepID=A0ABN4NGJ2_9BACL|nr:MULTISPECIES: gamma-glutamylcyclotransferase family protein [Geobacillus]AMX83677.1 gamma-glutamylcyclotransferase [Geobacillus subterraneus]KZS24587.1 gamma-glutamylcyclotransferase [Geobacillus subterraneus]OXB87892.1 gamma-glutamylcyclotransferase [Geobacillus uzenensis]QIZ67709.1 gamma-glutamylcyclotransferase [Geobacillus subterraneus]WPZ19908.1 gamma-glutamylcyclotransferase family protein [Geobacillus subterraneus]
MAKRRYRVFVYGTLLTGEDNHHVAAPYVLAVCPGKVNGRLYNVGSYPALVLGEDGEVEGEWLTVTEEGLKAMDELEDYAEGRDDNEYERVWVRDACQPVEGYVYVYPPEKAAGLPPIPSGSWRRREEKM